jgi:hypothetical protein
VVVERLAPAQQDVVVEDLEGIHADLRGGDDTVDASGIRAPVRLNLRTGTGNDQATGGSGDDTLTGGQGDDRLDALAGDDLLLGESGADTLTGGQGTDSFACGGFGDSFDATPGEVVAADCLAPVDSPSAPEPPPAEPPITPAEPPAELLPDRLLGFSKPRIRANLRRLSVRISNTHSRAISIEVGAVERSPGGGPQTVAYASKTDSLAPGERAVVRLKTPQALRVALAERLKRRGKVARRPVVTLTNEETGAQLSEMPRLKLTRRGSR